MNINIKDLKAKNLAIVEKMEALAASEMSDENQEKFDSLQAEFDKNFKSITNLQNLEKTKAEAEQKTPSRGSVARQILAESYGDYSPSTHTQETGWADSNGKPVMVYSKSDKMGAGGISSGKYLQGLITGNWAGADAERELFASTTTNLAQGGYLIPQSILCDIADKARNKMILQQAGCKVVQLENGPATLIRVIADPTAEIKTELENFSDTSPVFDKIDFKPVTIGCYVRMSAELAADAAKNLADTLEKIMTEVVAQKLDYLGLYGTGNSEPLGIRYADGVNIVPVSEWDYDAIIDGITEVQENSYSPNAYVLSPATNSTFAKLKDDYGRYLSAPEDVSSMQKMVSKSIDNDDIILGDFSNIVLGIRQGATFEASNMADGNFLKNGISFRIILRADWAVVRPSAFTVCSKNVS
ncbi:MAG: phage major capsid protein [Sedimentisphaerales bacterium]|nr:phage major capsid protein [Sedimentisphaerales bacterium]